jgi:hypothetical protein
MIRTPAATSPRPADSELPSISGVGGRPTAKAVELAEHRTSRTLDVINANCVRRERI